MWYWFAANKDKFWWFDHTWSHIWAPNQSSAALLENEMILNHNFAAVSNSLSTVLLCNYFSYLCSYQSVISIVWKYETVTLESYYVVSFSGAWHSADQWLFSGSSPCRGVPSTRAAVWSLVRHGGEGNVHWGIPPPAAGQISEGLHIQGYQGEGWHSYGMSLLWLWPLALLMYLYSILVLDSKLFCVGASKTDVPALHAHHLP